MLRAFRVIYSSVVSLCATEGSPGLCRLLPHWDAEDATAEVLLIPGRLGLFWADTYPNASPCFLPITNYP